MSWNSLFGAGEGWGGMGVRSTHWEMETMGAVLGKVGWAAAGQVLSVGVDEFICFSISSCGNGAFPLPWK